MESFRWDECFLTGLSDVDSQHHHLVNVINRFGDLLAQEQDVSDEAVDMVFGELADYTHYHFSEEEQFMEQVGLDERHLKPHKEAHRNFIDEVVQMHATVKAKRHESGEQVMRFLTHWLAYHILGTDKSMSRQIAAIQDGETAAEAYEREERQRSASTEPLLHALNGLFQQVSQRNRQLSELNKTLEQRVEERTRELSEANAQLEWIAMTDALTGLPNRRHALTAFSQEWEAATVDNSPMACMMIDADGFKQINDTYGHDAGDEVLRQFSRELKHAVRTDDIVARLGGDEFLIICPSTDLEGGLQVAEKMRSAVAAMRVPAGEDGEWRGSVSVGVSARQANMTGPEDLIKAADNGVYMAKEDGRNCVRTADQYD